jgi:hypothetical protein
VCDTLTLELFLSVLLLLSIGTPLTLDLTGTQNSIGAVTRCEDASGSELTPAGCARLRRVPSVAVRGFAPCLHTQKKTATVVTNIDCPLLHPLTSSAIVTHANVIMTRAAPTLLSWASEMARAAPSCTHSRLLGECNNGTCCTHSPLLGE